MSPRIKFFTSPPVWEAPFCQKVKIFVPCFTYQKTQHCKTSAIRLYLKRNEEPRLKIEDIVILLDALMIGEEIVQIGDPFLGPVLWIDLHLHFPFSVRKKTIWIFFGTFIEVSKAIGWRQNILKTMNEHIKVKETNLERHDTTTASVFLYF
jgi:hypothetical protein